MICHYEPIRRMIYFSVADIDKSKALEVKMIRKMTETDYEKIFDLWKSTDGMGLRSLDDSQQGISAFLKRNPATNFVAIDDVEIVGTILCGHDGRRGYIYHTVVKKGCQNQGIGTELVEAAISALQKEGITRVCLNVMETNECGKSFWQKRGWKKKGFWGFYGSIHTNIYANSPALFLAQNYHKTYLS